MCEAAFAEPGQQTDPVVALLPDGALLTGVFSSLSRSTDGACDFRSELGGEPSRTVPDFTVDASGAVLALLVTSADGATINQLQESLDGGQHFHALGPVLPDSVQLVATVDVAPSDPRRIYVSGLAANGSGVLLRSDDRGASFITLPLPTDAQSDEVPYIAAVDARNPDALYLRTDVWQYDEQLGVASAADALWYSSNAGVDVSELLRRGGKLFGFALSPDGEHVLVGYGDPDPLSPGFRAGHALRQFPSQGQLAQVPERVTVRVRLEPIGREVLDDLVASGHLSAAAAAAVPVHDLLPNRHLASTPGAPPELATLGTVSFEWGPATREHGNFRRTTQTMPLGVEECIGMPGRPAAN